ncbi:MAG: hypothetical protein U0P30_08555 [Vicinamibacterales bacterium]
MSFGLLQAAVPWCSPRHQSCPQATFLAWSVTKTSNFWAGATPAVKSYVWLSAIVRLLGGPLQGFTLAFCKYLVVSVHAPDGWTAELGTGEPRQTIDWSFNESATSRGIEPGKQVEGFAVTLAPGWVMSQYLLVHWAETSSGQVVDHDCP